MTHLSQAKYAGVVRKSGMKNADLLALICKIGLLVLAVTMGLSSKETLRDERETGQKRID